MAEEMHARLSPSSSERWIACPGSVFAQEAVVEKDTGSEASRLGTVAHTLLELCILYGFDPQDFFGQEIEKGYPKVVQHMIDGVRHALDWLEEYVDTYGRKNLIIVPEHRVYIGSMIGVDDAVCNGTSDLQIVHRDKSRLVTVDYKHGVKPVHAEDNPQMMLYTAGGIKEHGKFKEYMNVIVQPRAPKKRTVDENTYKQGKLTKFLDKAAKSATAALLPNAPRVAGDHCFFCRASANCQTYRQRASRIAADEFGEIEDPETIPTEKLNDILNEAHILEAWIKSVKARALRELMAGAKMADYELGWGQKTRVFENPQDVVEWCKRHKLAVDEYMPRSLLTPKQLEGLLKQHGIYPRKKRGQPAPDSPIAHLVTYNVPSPAVKPKGEARSAEEDFGE